jgi:hypothetical protein
MFRGRHLEGSGTSRPWRRPAVASGLLLAILAAISLSAAPQSWPRCLTGCTAKDVELLEVTAEVVGTCTPGGHVDAVLWAALHFNRNKGYCVRFVADVYVDDVAVARDLVSEPFNVLSKGTYSDIYLGTVSIPCGGSLTLRNIKVMWSVDNKLNLASNCQDGTCADYGPNSKCTGDQYGVVTVDLPLEPNPNQPPVAVTDQATTDENESVTIVVIANDNDEDGTIDPLTVTITREPTAGTVGVNPATGAVTYTPAVGFCGQDRFDYTVSDNDGAESDEAAVEIDVVCNAAPVAEDDAATTDENTSVAIDVLANDSDSDGSIDSSTLAITEAPRAGSVSIHPATGVVTYTPDPGSCGQDVFSYTVADDDGAASDNADVVVDVLCNDPPLAIDDLYTTNEGDTLAVPSPGVLANDVDAPGSPLSAILVDGVAHGTLTLAPDGSFLYVHDGSETTSDEFTYVANDGKSNSNVATVSMVVVPSNDPPTAVGDVTATTEDQPIKIDVLANDSDPDGDKLTVDWVTNPTNGTATNDGKRVTYTPDPDFHGTDTFSYGVTDGNGGTASASVTVAVSAENDPPVAEDDSASTDEDVAVSVPVLANDSDPDGDDLAIQSTAQPAHGITTNVGSSIVYTPSPGFSGIDAFTYTIADGEGGTDTATVTVAVALVNDPPLAVDDASTTAEDTPATIPVLANDSDPDGDGLYVQSVTKPNHGAAVSGGTGVVYTPAPGYSGPDAFSYTISDGNGGTDTATVTVTVISVNDPPIAQDDAQSTIEETPVAIAVLANDSDPDGDPLTVQSVTHPGHGSIRNDGDSLFYTPGAGFGGVDSFTYVVSDGHGATDTARVTVVVSTVNDPPIAQNDSASTREETLVNIPVLENDHDPDGDFLLVESFTQPAHGVVLNTRTSVSYIPVPGFRGTDSFRYTASDGNGGTSAAIVTVSVAAVNDPPIARDDTAATDEGLAVLIAILLNDQDPDGDPLTVQSIGTPDAGTARNLGDAIEYTPDPDFNGVDEFQYTISDGHGGSATATIFVAVAGVNDAPVAQDDSASTGSEEPISISVLANDEDPDGDSILITSTSVPSGGSVSISDGTLVYTPDPGFSGTDVFTYTVSDGRGGQDEATVTVGVLTGGQGGELDATAYEGRVIINEVAWAGTSSDPRDEWIELRNLGTGSVDLAGWALRWRSTHPTTSEEQTWKTLPLSGVIEGSGAAVPGELVPDVDAALRIERPSEDGEAWHVTGTPSVQQNGYFVLERRHDDTIADARANLLYDTTTDLSYELSDAGDIIMLIDAAGRVVDTANASNLGQTGWVAGSETTFGTMERVDPLGPDAADNWRTNLGVVARGQDASGRPLRGTPGSANSPDLERLESYAEIESAAVRRGETLQLEFALSKQDRRSTGWPWISVSRPGFAGQGGSVDLSQYSFAGQQGGGDLYLLDIGTEDLAPGAYTFLVIYGEGEALFLPILLTP